MVGRRNIDTLFSEFKFETRRKHDDNTYKKVRKILDRDGVDTNEWAIVELQGDLESRSNQPLNDQFIGDLHYAKNGTPILIVGHHILYGKETSLDKPIVVLEKQKRLTNDKENNKSITDDESSSKIESCTSYLAKAIVRKKLIFRARPKPIIANIPKMV